VSNPAPISWLQTLFYRSNQCSLEKVIPGLQQKIFKMNMNTFVVSQKFKTCLVVMAHQWLTPVIQLLRRQRSGGLPFEASLDK
jgi:hypothetical protein